MLSLQQDFKSEGVDVSMSQLYRWFDLPKRTVYYKAAQAAPKVQGQLEQPIKAMIEENPSFGYRRWRICWA